MANFQFKGIDEYIKQISILGKDSEEMIGAAIFGGAKIVTDQIRSNLQALPAVNDVEGHKAYQAKEPAPLTKKAKQGLLDGLGIAPMREENGYCHVKVGFDGYNALKTKKYPKGQPNLLIARVAENGSSNFERRPFIKPAVASTRAAAEKEMKEILDEEISKRMK